MKLTVERNVLVKALGLTQRVVERRNTYPILANVHITAGNDITLRATDLDIEVTNSALGTVSEPGVITVPAHTLYDIARKMADGSEIVIESASSDQIAIKSGRSRFTLATLAPDSFPDLKSGQFTHTFSMPAAALREIIERTQFAISTEETRYYLNGIFFHVIEVGGGAVLRAVATDGHRMARAETNAPDGSVGMPSIIVPKKTVAEVQKLLDGAGADAEVEVEISDTKIRFTLGNVVLLSKLIEGQFPDYDRVTPKNNDKVMKVDREMLSKAVDRVSTIASDRGGKAVKLKVVEGVLELSVTNSDHGNASEEMPVEFSEDATFEIGFNARYLLDVVGQIRTETTVFLFNDAGSPMLIREDGDGTALYVLMPMRV